MKEEGKGREGRWERGRGKDKESKNFSLANCICHHTHDVPLKYLHDIIDIYTCMYTQSPITTVADSSPHTHLGK